MTVTVIYAMNWKLLQHFAEKSYQFFSLHKLGGKFNLLFLANGLTMLITQQDFTPGFYTNMELVRRDLNRIVEILQVLLKMTFTLRKYLLVCSHRTSTTTTAYIVLMECKVISAVATELVLGIFSTSK